MAVDDFSSFAQAIGSTDNLYLLGITKYTKVASITFFLLETLSTLPDEVAYMWPAPLSFTKLLFLLNKYSPLIDTTLAITLDLITHDRDSCAIQFQALAYCYIIGTLFSEFILMTRTIALWGFDGYVIFLMVGAAVEMIPIAIYVTHDTVQSIQYPPNDVIQVVGCLPSTQDLGVWPAYFCVILAETGIVGLTLLKWYFSQRVDGSQSTVITTMYRDGTIFFVVVLTISVVNLSVMIFAPQGLSSCMQMPLRVIHSALCTRVLLNLRKAAAHSLGNTVEGFTKQTTLAFQAAPGFQDDDASIYELEEIGHD